MFVTKPRRRNSESMNGANDEERLYAEITALRRSLSLAESNEYRIRNQYQTLANQHNNCGNLRPQIQALENEVRRLRERNEDEQDNVVRLQERIRLMKRTSHDSYRDRYEDKAAEVETLKRQLRERDSYIALEETRLASYTRTITNMKRYLNQLGYRYMER